jgi:hypothetical protein
MLTSQHQETVLQDFTVMKFQSLGNPVLSRLAPLAYHHIASTFP